MKFTFSLFYTVVSLNDRSSNDEKSTQGRFIIKIAKMWDISLYKEKRNSGKL